MARLSWAALFLALSFQMAWGVSDPRPDVMGVYFDETGDQTCHDTLVPFTPFSVWIVYTSPTVPAILGFEAGFHLTGDLLELGVYPPCGISILPPELDDLHIGCPDPLVASAATPLMRIEYMSLLPVSEVVFWLENARVPTLPGDQPTVVLPDYTFLPVVPGYPAFLTADCSVPVQAARWGTIKSLYR